VTVFGTILVGGQPVAGVPMQTYWYFPNGLVQACNAPTASNGQAACSVVNNNPSQGFVVQIKVIFTYGGQQYVTYSSYIM
jgi:hypothetical protein